MSEKQIVTIEDLLFEMQEYKDATGQHFPQITNLLLPADGQPIYNIDLDTRTVDAPDILSVQFDHNAEIVYFRCPRYYDNMDLATTVCLIQYKNAPHLNEFGKEVIFLGDCVPVFKDIIKEKLNVQYSYAPAHNNRQRAGAVAADAVHVTSSISYPAPGFRRYCT